MTGVAYRDGIMAADCGVFMGVTTVIGSTIKIGFTKDGGLWAYSGKMSYTREFTQWLIKTTSANIVNKPLPCHLHRATDDIEVILVRSNGDVHYIDGDGISDPVVAPFHAGGCVSGFLLGAMTFGANATQAVFRSQHNSRSVGSEVKYIELGDKSRTIYDYGKPTLVGVSHAKAG